MNELLIKEFAVRFDLHPAAPEGTQHSFAASELVQEQGMEAFVKAYRPLMKALDDKAVAAYFGGYLSSIALAVQYSVTGFSCVPDFSLDNLAIHLVPADGYCRIAYSLQEWKPEYGPAAEQGGSREAWRSEVLIRFYKETAGPLIRSISQVSGLAPSEIWGQLPSKFNYYVEAFAAGVTDTALLQRIADDYGYLKDELPAEVFQMPRNPFQVKVRRMESLADPEQTVQMRNRCCMYYRTEGGRLCYTCPRMKESERAERREEYRLEMAAAKE
ncbi:(2Fe-2S)-binding protein [Paenibacillus sp. MMS20-IR301]|uniref:(2Fe-2S)-binding protein n=1 Tax=Paenibacillus sp. MMS20-IR301 TaxID=2895946 RepID=UPI0028F022A1|nr:(2Fe-2S)-binding protein [Paenibacillus sp. MMS20-IR301]WNS45076.1 (2Fe-2S)-binding protein [Paenibacillus sp. MMS20-IR301]